MVVTAATRSRECTRADQPDDATRRFAEGVAAPAIVTDVGSSARASRQFSPFMFARATVTSAASVNTSPVQLGSHEIRGELARGTPVQLSPAGRLMG